MPNKDLIFRDAKEDELDAVYLMGEDAWAEGSSREEYLDGCRSSEKYKRGQFKVLSDNDELVCSLIAYTISNKWLGIGSIATPTEKRGNGYASQLVKEVCDKAFKSGFTSIFLYSDISPDFYSKLGFKL